MMTNLSPKIPDTFACENCDYYTSNKKDYNKHLLTRKHQISDKFVTNDDKLSPKNPQKSCTYECCCGKVYKHRQGLSFHKKTCVPKEPTTQAVVTNQQIQDILIIVKDVLIEQNKQTVELAKLAGSNNNNTNANNVNSHNKFNINMFLNEKCKDALNISDFVSQLDIGIKDLEETGRIGFAEGISKIIINGLNQLDVHDKPLHCNDSKREVLYIKDSDKWIKETDNKPILTKAIKEVAYKNMKQIYEWQKINPEFADPDSKQNDKYLKIVMEAMSGSSNEECEKNYNKIIRNISKKTTIDKECNTENN